jgi:hypothetical protein
MASPAVYDAIRAFLEAQFTTTPLIFENEGMPSTDTWTLIEFASVSYTQESIGSRTQATNRFDEEGSFFAHVMVRIGTGVRSALSTGFAIADLFRGLTLLNGALEFTDVVVGYGGPDDEGNWYRVSVNIGWRNMDSRRP